MTERKRHPGHIDLVLKHQGQARTVRALEAVGGLAVVELELQNHGAGFYVFTLGGVAEGYRANEVHDALCYANKLGSEWPRWAEITRDDAGRVCGPIAEARRASRECSTVWNMRGGWLGEDIDFTRCAP